MLHTLLIFLLLASALAQTEIFDLGTGASWHVNNSNGTIHCAATVPGMIHTDLMSCGVISEPYHVDNDALQRWIPEETWSYTTTFTTPPLSFPFIDLTFDGLATVAIVTLNGVAILSTNNQFRVWRVHVRPLLYTDGNTNCLVVAIASSTRYAADKNAAYNMSTHNITT